MFYTQTGRPLRVTTPLGPDALLLTAFAGEEGISQLFHFQLEMLAPPLSPVAFEKIMGQSITVELAVAEGYTRVFNGIVQSFTEGAAEEAFTTYRAEMTPRLWLWTRRVQSRIFQQMTVPAILQAVLQGLDVSLDLTGSYPPRDYCVQYHESDFAFASRLMEEEGIFYYFKHTQDGHQLVLSDGSSRAPAAPFLDTVLYEPIRGGSRGDTRITSWQKTQQLCIASYAARDYSFEVPGQTLEAQTPCRPTAPAGQVTHQLNAGSDDVEVYEYPGGYARRFDGIDPGGSPRPQDLSHLFESSKQTTDVRMEEQAAQSLRIDATSTCPQLLPGHKLTLLRHGTADGAYLTVRNRHQARLRAGYQSGPEQDSLEYDNQLSLIPFDLAYRPPRVTPRPTIPGPQTAVVTGPAGSQIFLDRYGRIKVQFHWDRQGKNDANSSCWIRVAQVWAGNTWGAFFWPRVGHEVVVLFEEGDPDQPLVVGSVYNATNMPPLTLPQEAMLGGIKSCSFRGDPSQNFNTVIFHDVPGHEYVHIHSETYQLENTESSRYQYTPQTHLSFTGGFPGI